MKRYQFDAMRKEFGMGWSYYRPKEGDPPIRLYIATGRYKGKIGVLSALDYRSKLTVTVDEETSIKLTYTQVERIDANDQPIISPVTDMTGREITVDSWVCYSKSAGRSSHSLEIGKVTKITPSGGLRVKAYLADGEKIELSTWGRKEETNVGDPDRCILLPVEATTMTLWILQDFEGLNDDDQT